MSSRNQNDRIEKLLRQSAEYFGRQYQPMAVLPRSKKPLKAGWLDHFMDFDELKAIIEAYPDINLGVVLGFPSNQLIDVDIDQFNAISIFHRLMSSTNCIFGRHSKPGSHLIYRISPDEYCQSVEYKHPVTGKMIAELRGNQRMTVFPGSIHETGEEIDFVPGCNGDPTKASYSTLCWETAMACSAALLAEHWIEGCRHNKTRSFAGFCAANNIEEQICERIIEAIVEATSDVEIQDRLTAIHTSYQRFRDGKGIDGIGSFTDLIGEATAHKVCKWMGLTPKKEPKRQGVRANTKQQIADTDLDFARSFSIYLNDKMIFCDTIGSFLERHCGGYTTISDSKAMSHVHSFLDHQLKISSCDIESRSVKRMMSSERMSAILKVSRTLINVSKDNFDRNPMLVGCLNGILDIEKGMLIDTDDLITRKIGTLFDLNAVCPSFEEFLNVCMARDTNLILFLQRVFGYILSALTSEQCMFIFVGEGSNGKSTLQNIMYKVMGEYASAASMQTLVKDRFSSHKTDDVASLEGHRYVFAQEGESNHSLAEAKIKRMTGGDPMSVRALYKAAETIQPVFKLCLFTNRVPKIDATDNAIWRRLHIIPFSVTIPPEKRIAGLDRILESELSGILNWMVKGFQEFVRLRGLCPPQKVIDLRNSFRTSNDTVEQYVDICCDSTDLEVSTSVKLLYDTYVVWCSNSGIDPLVTSEFGKNLERLGYKVKRKNTGNHRLGIRLK